MSVHSSGGGRVTVNRLRRMKSEREPIVALTAYDYSTARLMDEAGVDVILVGDSLGNVVQGRDSTIPVTMDAMVYHTACVARGTERAFLMADMPFLSFWSVDTAMTNAARLMKEGGAHMVKLECTADQEEIVHRLVSEGVPVCAHLGLRPQSVHKLGGYRVQGRDQAAAEAMIAEAGRLEAAGADLLLLEAVPESLATQIALAVEVPVIGIGAGSEVDGQVLVLYDVIGLTPGPTPRFAQDFMTEAGSLRGAVEAYIGAVRGKRFPAEAHSFK